MNKWLIIYCVIGGIWTSVVYMGIGYLNEMDEENYPKQWFVFEALHGLLIGAFWIITMPYAISAGVGKTIARMTKNGEDDKS